MTKTTDSQLHNCNIFNISHVSNDNAAATAAIKTQIGVADMDDIADIGFGANR